MAGHCISNELASPERLTAANAELATALLLASFGGTRYVSRLLELAERAASPNDEVFGLIVRRESAPSAMLLLERIAGAEDVTKVHCLLGGNEECRALMHQLFTSSPRIIFAETPDDVSYAPMREILGKLHFQETARIADYVADGVAMVLLTRHSTGS